MHHSAAWGQVDCLQVLAERGADSKNLTRYKETPKDMAERYGHQECVNYLRFHGELFVDPHAHHCG